jgi:hypothetical protein
MRDSTAPSTLYKARLPRAAYLIASDTDGMHLALSMKNRDAPNKVDLVLVDVGAKRVRQLSLATRRIYEVAWADTEPATGAVQAEHDGKTRILLFKISPHAETPVLVSVVASDEARPAEDEEEPFHGPSHLGFVDRRLIGFDALGRHLLRGVAGVDPRVPQDGYTYRLHAYDLGAG